MRASATFFVLKERQSGPHSPRTAEEIRDEETGREKRRQKTREGVKWKEI